MFQELFTFFLIQISPEPGEIVYRGLSIEVVFAVNVEI